MNNNAKTFKPKAGYLVLLVFFVILFLGFAAGCVHFALDFRDKMFYILAGVCIMVSGIMLFVLFQVSNVFTIRYEGFEFKKVLYPWRHVFLGGIRKEIVKHTVMFVPVAQTSSEHFYVVLLSEKNPKVKMKKIKILNKAYSEYNEIRALIAKYTKDAHK